MHIHVAWTHVWSNLSKHIVTVIPDTVEPQHIPVQLQKLPQFVVGRWSGVAVLRLATGLHVWIHWFILRSVQVNAFTAHELLKWYNNTIQ